MGYGESEAYRAGLYMTDEGYSFYGPEDEEENDMAVEPMSMEDLAAEMSAHYEATGACYICSAHLESGAPHYMVCPYWEG